jgi:ubiquinol-cytochrome c reductase cytochrome b subunit
MKRFTKTNPYLS